MTVPTGQTCPTLQLAPITAADYNTWATFNNQPLSTTPAGAAQLAAIRATVNANRLSTGGLPPDFYHVPLPQGFASQNALSFDITKLDQYKLYRIRQTYETNFGTLTGGRPETSPRYVQFGIRIFF